MRSCLLILLSLVGCASTPRSQQHVRPAQVERLDCGGRSCTITTVGESSPTTVIFVQE